MKIVKSTYAKALLVAVAALLALVLSGCIGTTPGISSSQGSTSSTAAASSSSGATTDPGNSAVSPSNGTDVPSSSSSSANASQDSSSTSAASSASSSSVTSTGSPDPSSYAENNLSSSTYQPPNITVEKNGHYTDKDHVALYIHLYGKVPSNYITKTKARKTGWVQEEGNLDEVLPGMSIGGGGFYNDDHMMPDAPDRTWYECDIDYQGGFRNAKRIVYSNDGLIYYTNDHYKTFERLY